MYHNITIQPCGRIVMMHNIQGLERQREESYMDI